MAGCAFRRASSFPSSVFEEAAEKNLAERIARLAPRSIQTERERMRLLCTVFGSLKVNRITVEMVRSYMTGRTGANVTNNYQFGAWSSAECPEACEALASVNG